jgi:hypothetical protein
LFCSLAPAPLPRHRADPRCERDPHLGGKYGGGGIHAHSGGIHTHLRSLPQKRPHLNFPPKPPTITFATDPTQAALGTPAALCDDYSFDLTTLDVTVPDGTPMTPGQEFVKTWKIKKHRHLHLGHKLQSHLLLQFAAQPNGWAPNPFRLPALVAPGAGSGSLRPIQSPCHTGRIYRLLANGQRQRHSLWHKRFHPDRKDRCPINEIELKQAIKEKARQLGFILAGVTSFEPPAHFTIFENWLDANHHATMDYLASERSRIRRADPKQILPECKSILVLALPYTRSLKKEI